MDGVDLENPPRETPGASESGATAAGGQSAAEAVRHQAERIVDVWSRTAPKYRIRAVVLLVVNLALFCGLCVFVHWLHFARPFDFSPESYLEPLRFWDPSAPNLNDFILAPINVVDVPAHAVVLGLVLAVIVAVPIVVAILYRWRYALPFLLAVVVFAHMPWMAITLLGSCILAAVRPFRMKFRYGSALVGLLPVLLYLYLATRGTPELLASYGSPTEKMLLVAPWVIAILGAAVMAGLVLLLARLVRYRPGAVAPVLAVTAAVPVTLFHMSVGADELAYRRLEAEYGPRSPRFEPVLKSRETQRAIWQLISEAIGSRGKHGQWSSELLGLWSLRPEKFRELKRTVSRKFLAGFLRDRMEVVRACEQFIAGYPQSRYVPNVLYIQARALDMRLDEAKLAATEPARELYTDFPHAAAEPAWLRLFRSYPDSPFAIEAGLRLGELRLRAGKMDEALKFLRFAVERAEKLNGHSRAVAQRAGLLRPAPPESTLDFQPEPYRLDALELIELIEANRDDPRYGNEPLAELARLDPRRAGYREQLLRLAARYQDGRLYDNLVVRWAATEENPRRRAALLEDCLRAFAGQDAALEASYRLAEVETQGQGTDEARLRRGIERLRRLIAEHPHSVWATLAAERLAALEPQAPAAEEKP